MFANFPKFGSNMIPYNSMMTLVAVASALQLAACLIGSVQLFRHRKESRDYTRHFLGFCGSFFVVTSALLIMNIVIDPESTIFTERLNPLMILLGLLSQILALVYPLCVITPRNYYPFAFMFLPWAVFAMVFAVVPSWTHLHTMADLSAHLSDGNVVLRLVALGFYSPYVIYLCWLLLPGSLNGVSVSRLYFRGFGIFALIILALHLLFFFTGNLWYQFFHEIILGGFFYIITLFDLEVRLFPKEEAAVEEVPEKSAQIQEEKVLEYASRPLWERICQVLDKEEAWRQPDLSVESLARMCGSNVPYVISCIKRETGYSANEYINRKRIAYVCSRLDEDPELNLQEVFFEAGYRVRTTAWRNFRLTVGVSPSEYRFSKR